MANLPIGVAALSRALAAGAVSSVEATREYLARIDRDNPRLRAFVHVAGDTAFAQAEDADERRRKGQSLGPLDGVPIAAKDNIDIAGMPTAGGFDHYRNAVARQDAFVMQALREAGAVFLGKLNMHEGALGATTDNPWFGRCENPLQAGYTPGGSSGGSGSATAAGLAAGTLGSDTLGSVRIPAAYCGVAGIKPTYGLLSTRGVMPISWTLDHVGFLAPHVEDLRLLLAAGARFDRGWPHARKAPYSTTWIRNHDSVCGLRVGTIAKFEGTEIEPEILAAYEASQHAMTDAGAALVEVRLPGYDFTRVRRECLLMIEMEGSAIHGEAIAANPAGFSDEFRAMIAFGSKQSGTRAAISYRRFSEVRSLLANAVEAVDVMLLPTAGQTAFPFTQPAPVTQADLCGIANILEAPAGCIPWGTGRNGLPVSMQIVGRRFEDDLVLDVLQVMARLAPSA